MQRNAQRKFQDVQPGYTHRANHEPMHHLPQRELYPKGRKKEKTRVPMCCTSRSMGIRKMCSYLSMIKIYPKNNNESRTHIYFQRALAAWWPRKPRLDLPTNYLPHTLPKVPTYLKTGATKTQQITFTGSAPPSNSNSNCKKKREKKQMTEW